MKITGRVGLGLLIIAAASWGGWSLWANTRKWCPASVPVSLAKGSQTRTNEFQINVSGPYEIAVEANSNNTTDLNALTCTLGTGPSWPDKTCSSPPVLKMSWTLLSGDKVVAQGSSDETHGGSTSYNSATRIIGYFQGQRGQQFRLATETLFDGSNLAAANPRLKVNVGGTLYEFSLVAGGFIRWACSIVGGIGLILLLASIFKRKRGAIAGPVAAKT